MVPVLLCILVLVLSSGAVLRVVLERDVEPTGEGPPPPQEPAPIVAPPVPTVPPVAPVAVAGGPTSTAPRALVPALPRHRARSSALLLVLVVIVGVLVAAAIGTVLALLAFALRSSVTS